MKKITSIILVLCLTLVSTCNVFAFSADKHNEIMEEVLFGSSSYSDSQLKKAKEKIQLLKAASYLTLDQFGGDGKESLTLLSNAKVPKLPKSIDKIDFSSGSDHRKYTHMGWNTGFQESDNGNWAVRKKILQNTVKTVFNFGFFNELFGKICDKNDSFAELVYYVHVLGDYIHYFGKYDGETEDDHMIPFAKTGSTKKEKDCELFCELQDVLERLFVDQKDRDTYRSLMVELETLAEEARNFTSSAEDIDTDEEFESAEDYALRLKDILTDYVPLLLKEENFFKKEFK